MNSLENFFAQLKYNFLQRAKKAVKNHRRNSNINTCNKGNSFSDNNLII